MPAEKPLGEKPTYALVCAGGGAHGAYQVGVLKYIHEHFCRGQASPFRVFSGTSCGSLNTTFFATRSYDARDARLELERLWIDFDIPQYSGSFLRNTSSLLMKKLLRPSFRRASGGSLLDPTYLRNIVERGFKREALDRAFAQGTTLAASVSTTELRSSRLVFFQEGPSAAAWTGINAMVVNTRLAPHHVTASCSVPFVFPPVRIGDHFFADGGVANQHPFGVVINMGATRVLTIATDMPLPTELPTYPPGYKPGVADMMRMLTAQLGDQYAADAQWIEIVHYFLERKGMAGEGGDGRIIEGDRPTLGRYRPVEIELFTPSRRIRYTDTFSPEFFDEKLKGQPTALMFRKDFVRPLIDFGYEDARARHEWLARFFDDDRPKRQSTFSVEEMATPQEGGT